MEHLQQDLIKIILSIVLGSLLGAEREYRTKSAGFRTLILVCTGSALFTIFSIRIGGVSPDRIAANIVTGIGFLGAGVIFRSENKMSGVTTAAVIWIAAAVGMGVGLGEYVICSISTVAVLLVLLIFTSLEVLIDKMNQTRRYAIVCEFREETLYDYEKIFSEYGLRFRRTEQSKTGNEIKGTWEVMGTQKNHERLTDLLLKDKAIKAFDF
jgi:putative Mg2+ transporter-C (MgtC) family protein